MPIPSAFIEAEDYDPREVVEYRNVTLPARFGSVANEYEQARDTAAMFDRSDRGILLATGKARKSWLHNLVTNDVNKLEDYQGCYAFAIDVRGRVQFDLNILSLPDALWLDIDRAALPLAKAHLEKLLISEDVQLVDASEAFARLGVAGPRAPGMAAWVGVDDLLEMPALSSVTLDDNATGLMRHDFAGVPGFELIAQREGAADWWDRLRTEAELLPAGLTALDALRIEAGIPWLGRDIDDRVLPPETGQIERGVSYHKGCYLGQEVIERMRSHGVLARRLVRLTLDDAAGVTPSAPLKQGETEVGRVTSLVKHPQEAHWIGLGYLKTSVTDPKGLTTGDPARPVTIEEA